MEERNTEYFLSPDFQNESSIMKIFANVLARSDAQDLLNVFESEFLLVFSEYANLLGLFGHIITKYGYRSDHFPDKYTREKAKREFIQNCPFASVL